MRDLAGKTAFVTGAASGIGFGIATALAQAGVKVMLCDIEEAALTKAAADLKLTNADVDGVKADVSLKGELQAAADATVARYGKVHILVNNAGVGGGSGYGRWTDASWNWTLSVNPSSPAPWCLQRMPSDAPAAVPPVKADDARAQPKSQKGIAPRAREAD